MHIRANTHLLILGEATHDSRIHNAVEQHREGVDGLSLITLVLIYHGKDFLIGVPHRLYSVLQRTYGCLIEKLMRSIIFRKDVTL